MAARNCLAIMANIKAVGFDLNVLSPYTKVRPDYFLSLQSFLKEKGIKTTAIEPLPSAFIDLEKFLGLRANEILYVGAKHQDIEQAHKAGLISVLVDPEEKNFDFGQNFSVASVDELLDYL